MNWYISSSYIYFRTQKLDATAKNIFQIFNLQPKKHIFKKKRNMVLNEKIISKIGNVVL